MRNLRHLALAPVTALLLAVSVPSAGACSTAPESAGSGDARTAQGARPAAKPKVRAAGRKARSAGRKARVAGRKARGI